VLKRLIELLLSAGAGLAGNLVANWIQQDLWTNVFTEARLIGTLVGGIGMLVVIAGLESERALRWNWPWHRYWYLYDVLGDPRLRQWEANFASLAFAEGQREAFGGEILVGSTRKNLVQTLRTLITHPQAQVVRALVLGEPGSGKTTGLMRLTLDLAKEGRRYLGLRRPIPILVHLGKFPGGKLLDYVGQAIQDGTRGRSGRILGKSIEELAKRNRVVLLFDGLDEALSERPAIVRELVNLIEARAFQVDLSDEAVRIFIRASKNDEGTDEATIWERLTKGGFLEPGVLGEIHSGYA
jgi:NACHT domain